MHFTYIFNSRIGSSEEGNSDIDNISRRLNIDTVCISHRHEFLDFLGGSKFCALNGQFGTESNKFTLRSVRSNSVVYYFCVPHNVLEHCANCKVISCKSIVESYNNSFAWEKM